MRGLQYRAPSLLGKRFRLSQVNENDPRREGWFKGDDDMMVDRLVSVCAAQKKGSSTVLPGFGRDLVPYFVPGNTEPDEEDINANLAKNPEATSPSRPQQPQQKKAKKKSGKKLDFSNKGTCQIFQLPVCILIPRKNTFRAVLLGCVSPLTPRSFTSTLG